MQKIRLVYANTIDYFHDLQQRPQHLMNLLADRNFQIDWIDQTHLPHRYRTKISDNLTVYHDWDKYVKNNAGKVDIYFASWSHRWVDIEQLKPKFTIYDSLDLFPQNESEEANMVAHADVILATTKNIMEYQSQHTDKPIYLCENGCFPDYRNDDIPKPIEFQNTTKPNILFSGALAINPKDGWCNIDLIKRTAYNYNLFVVGMPWGATPEQLSELEKIGVKFLGSRDYDTLQQYYKHCDVNILPFKRCQTSDYSFPLKVVEGCNLGKICVATDIPVVQEFAKEFPNAVLVSNTVDSFLNNIKIALKNKDNPDVQAECMQFADMHSWDSKVDTIERAIKEYCDGNGITI